MHALRKILRALVGVCYCLHSPFSHSFKSAREPDLHVKFAFPKPPTSALYISGLHSSSTSAFVKPIVWHRQMEREVLIDSIHIGIIRSRTSANSKLPS